MSKSKLILNKVISIYDHLLIISHSLSCRHKKCPKLYITHISNNILNAKYYPDSANDRVSALGAGGHGFDPGRHTKGVRNGTSGYFAWRSAL